MERNHLCNFGRRHHEENFCKIILNLDQFFARICRLKIFYLELRWPCYSVERNPLVNFGRGHNEEQFCDFILNLDQWFRSRCCLKDFLSGALAALLFRGGGPFMQI